MTYTVSVLTAVCAVALAAAAIWLRRRRPPRDRGAMRLGAGPAPDAEPSKEVLERLRAVVRGRPARERLVLILTEFEGLSIEDTAHVLGISVDQVTAFRRSIRGALHAAADGQTISAARLEPLPPGACGGT
jgi:DNA-directed RNA polymerase specialized sigma24 family protein